MPSYDGMVFDEFEQQHPRAKGISLDSLLNAQLFPRIYERFLGYLHDEQSPTALARRQADALQALLKHAVTNVPAYRDLRAPDAVEPDAIDDALASFPLLTRETARESLEDLCDDELDPDDCVALETSGTTGTRLRVVADTEHVVCGYAERLLRLRRFGIPTQCRVIRPGTWFLGWFEYAALTYGLARKVDFGLGGTDREQLAEMASRAVAYRPHIATGLPSALADLATLMRDTGNRLPVRLVITYGEQLPASTRAVLEQAYEAPVSDCYGLIELGPVACQCENGTYHVSGERCWVEILDDDLRHVPVGESGQVVVTSFTNRVMPLVRYVTGDVGALTENTCECGVLGQTLRVVEGRVPRDILLPNGERINQIAVVRILRKMPVDRFQLIQESASELRVLVTTVSGAASDTFVDTFVPLAEAALKGQLRVTAQVVEERQFVRLPNGKVTDFVALATSQR
jgi:phenylacetate-CoA ligase